MTDIPAIGDLLNAQTARIHWSELTRHFARGVVVAVDAELDLLEVAGWMVEDNGAALRPHFKSGRVLRANDDHAREWSEQQSEFWAVVVAPWVLVQLIPAKN